LILPVDAAGRFTREPGSAFGPNRPVWSYSSPLKTDFHSARMSSAQRLANGNTLICSGDHGVVFEVTPAKETVWKFVNPEPPGSAAAVGLDDPALTTANPQSALTIVDPSRGALFRAYRYGLDYPAFADRDLTQGGTLEALHAKVGD
jgi:hypothetical protein